MKKALLFLAILFLAGCAVDPVSTDSTQSNGLRVVVIGKDAEGCTIKRFSDGGYYHYYVTGCGPSLTSTQGAKYHHTDEIASQ